MNNCLKEQLKEVVQNENLEILGAIKISFAIPSSPSSAYNAMYCNSPVTLELSDRTKNLYSANTALGYTKTYNQGLIGFQLLDAGNYDLIIKPKYGLNSSFELISVVNQESLIDLKQFDYTSITSIINSRATSCFKGDIAGLKNLSLEVIKFNNEPLVTGDFVETFGPMITLTNFKFANSAVYGDIVEFVRKQVKAGRDSYTFSNLETLGATTGIKFNNQAIRNRATNTLTWADNAQDNTKIDITLQTGTPQQGDAPMTATVSKLT